MRKKIFLMLSLYPFTSLAYDSAPLVGAFMGGYLANVFTEPDTKANKITNATAITMLFGIQTLCAVGVIIDNTIYASGKKTLFGSDDQNELLGFISDIFIRGGLYFLGKETAGFTKELVSQKKINNEKNQT
jgi:hypothetical protein